MPKIDVGDDIDLLKKQAIEGLRNDEEVYRLIHEDLHLSSAQVKAFLATLLDYQEDVSYCAHCPGYDACDKANPHFEMCLKMEEGQLMRYFSPCRVVRKMEELESRYIVRDFPEQWQELDFRSVDKTQKRMDAVAAMIALIRGKPLSPWIYLCGTHGSGKSYLLAMFANTYARTHKGCAYCDTSALIDKLKELQINAKKDFEERFALLCECPLLCLDDFGNEFKTDFVFSSILFPLLSARDKAGLPTAFSSDFPIEDIETMYSAKIGAPRARQLRQLLFHNCKKQFDVSGLKIY